MLSPSTEGKLNQNLEKLSGTTWSLEVPEGSTVSFKFDTYKDWQSMPPTSLSMGDMKENDFRILRDPKNANRLIIQSNLPFESKIL